MMPTRWPWPIVNSPLIARTPTSIGFSTRPRSSGDCNLPAIGQRPAPRTGPSPSIGLPAPSTTRPSSAAPTSASPGGTDRPHRRARQQGGGAAQVHQQRAAAAKADDLGLDLARSPSAPTRQIVPTGSVRPTASISNPSNEASRPDTSGAGTSGAWPSVSRYSTANRFSMTHRASAPDRSRASVAPASARARPRRWWTPIRARTPRARRLHRRPRRSSRASVRPASATSSGWTRRIADSAVSASRSTAPSIRCASLSDEMPTSPTSFSTSISTVWRNCSAIRARSTWSPAPSAADRSAIRSASRVSSVRAAARPAGIARRARGLDRIHVALRIERVPARRSGLIAASAGLKCFGSGRACGLRGKGYRPARRGAGARIERGESFGRRERARQQVRGIVVARRRTRR